MLPYSSLRIIKVEAKWRNILQDDSGELDKLLNEIHKVTSREPYSEESGPRMVSLEGSLSTVSEKLQNYGGLDEEKSQWIKLSNHPLKGFNQRK